MDRRTLTMNWDGLGEDDDDDNFFESRDRLSTAIPFDLASSGSDDDDEFEDSRLSFVSTLSSASIKKFQGIEIEAVSDSFTSMEDYGMWMAEPGDIKERRRRLLQGMGLSSNKDLLKLKSAKIVRAISRKVETSQDSKPPKAEYSHSVVGAASTSPTHPMACSLSTSPVHPIARTNSDRPPQKLFLLFQRNQYALLKVTRMMSWTHFTD